MKVFVIFIILTTLYSCASSRTSPPHKDSTRESILDDEKERVIRYYEELRKRDWQNYRKGRNSFKTIIPKPYSPRQKAKTPPPQEEVIIEYDNDKLKEFEIESEQIMAFYCMAQRKNKKFSDRNDCLAFTEDKKMQCRKEDPLERVTPPVISCLKKSLRVN